LGAGAGLTIAAACAEPGVSAASVYRWKKLLAETPASEPQGAKPLIRISGATRSPGANLPFLAVQVLPKSPLMKAFRYASNNWKALHVYTTDGRLTIDKNMSERTVRMIAIGRKNWLFIGSEAAGYRMAVLYSIVASAKRHHLEPFACVRDLLLQMRSLCCSPAGTATAVSPPDPPNTGLPMSDAARLDATSHRP